MDSSEKESMTRVIDLVVAEYLRPLEDGPSRVNQINVDKIKTSAKILLKVIRNALREDSASTSDIYRKIRLQNPTIQQKIVQVPGAIDILTVVGFAYCELEENGKLDKYLVFMPDEKNLGLGNLASSVIQEELEKFQSRENTKKATVSKPKYASDDDNQFLSEEERTKRNIRSKEAKKAKLAEKERALRRWQEDKETRMEIAKKRLVVKQKVKIDHDNSDQTHNGNHNDEKPAHIHNNETLISIRAKVAQAWEIKQEQNTIGDGGHDVVKGDDAKKRQDLDATTLKEKHTQDQESLQAPKDGDQKDDDGLMTEACSKPAAKPPSDEDQTAAATDVNDKQGDPSTNKQLMKSLPSWEECLECIPRCGPANGIRNSSTFYKNDKRTASSPSPTCFRRLFAEFSELKSSLPSNKRCSAWLRFDEETPQYIRALLTAPLPGPSPYSGGVFIFDVYVPDTYPLVPPKVNIINTGGGTVRFGPNLYADGKVCLSLLGTWPGPKWSSKHSSLHQLLVSIQSLMLGVEHPYFLEPGYGGWEAKVKEGDFASVGKTLSGDVVKEDLTLPLRAWVYEDNIRIGCIRHSMLEPLGIACWKRCNDKNDNSGKDAKIKPAMQYLLPFEDVIKAHFYHNKKEILVAVTAWLSASRPTNLKDYCGEPPNSTAPPPSQMSSQGETDYPTNILISLQMLFPKLESCMNEVRPPSFEKLSSPPLLAVATAATAAENDDSSLAMDPVPTPDRLPTQIVDNSKKAQENSEIEILCQQMEEAARNTNFILAGQLQKEIKQIEEVLDLKEKMKSAALKADFILAGEYQARLKSLEQHWDDKSKRSSNTDDQHMLDSDNSDEDDGFEEVEDEEDEMYAQYGTKHGWGLGQALNGPLQGTKDILTGDEKSRKKAKKGAEPLKPKELEETVIISRLPIKEPCHLRIRLPGSTNKSIMGEFDSNEKLAVIYKWVNTLIPVSPSSLGMRSPRYVQLPGIYDTSGSQALGVAGGAFANPYSLYGFTLITAHPKCEYSLEMHGSTSLKDLGMTPSAMLTVMMCSSRGQVKRGALESKLAKAQGDAMDVENLGFEALQELVEKIGVASPGDGTWKGIDKIALEKISIVVSPKEFLAQKSSQEEDSKCPICLGDFDPKESDPQLLTLKYCHHTFHSSCLRTWFATKTNCPICNYSYSQFE